VLLLGCQASSGNTTADALLWSLRLDHAGSGFGWQAPTKRSVWLHEKGAIAARGAELSPARRHLSAPTV
jgi:hypothetical protein